MVQERSRHEKSIYMLVAVMLCVVGTFILLFVGRNSNKNSVNSNDDVGDIDKKDTETISFLCENQINGSILHEFVGVCFISKDNYDLIEKFSNDCFYKGHSLKTTYESDEVDLEAFYRDYPGYKEFAECIDGNEDPDFTKYPNDVRSYWCDIWKEHIHEYVLEEGYTSDNSFAFINCRFTNTLEKSQKLSLSNIEYYVYDDERKDYWCSAELIYFDKSQHIDSIEREHMYFEYVLEPGEVLECTIGIKLNYHNPNNTSAPKLDNIYMGYFDQELLVNYDGKEEPRGQYIFNLANLKQND